MIFLFFLFQTIPLFFDSFYQEDLKYITFFVEESDCAYKIIPKKIFHFSSYKRFMSRCDSKTDFFMIEYSKRGDVMRYKNPQRYKHGNRHKATQKTYTD